MDEGEGGSVSFLPEYSPGCRACYTSLLIKHVPLCFKSVDWGKNSFLIKDIFHTDSPLCLTYTEQPPPKLGVLLLPLASPFYYLAGIVINDVISVADMEPLGIVR